MTGTRHLIAALGGTALLCLIAPAARAQTNISSGTYNGYVASAGGSPYNISGGTFLGSTTDGTTGTVCALTEEGFTQVNISGGDFSTGSLNAAAVFLQGEPNTSLNISGGSFHNSSDGIFTIVPGVIDISGGSFNTNVNHGLFAGGDTQAIITGGDLSNNQQGALYAQGSSISVSGGTFTTAGTGGFDAWSDGGAINIYGGTYDASGSLTAFSAFNGGTINFFGSGLQLSGSSSGNSGGGTLTGTLSDGTAINSDYGFFTSQGGTINLNPGTSAATAYQPNSTTTLPNGSTLYTFSNISRGAVTIGAGNYLGPDGQVYTPQGNIPAGSILIPSTITVYPGQGVNEAGSVVFLNPDGSAPGNVIIPAAPVYVDPKMAYGYTYTMKSGSLFTEITGLPVGFAGPFDIVGDGHDYGTYGPGQTLVFNNGGVTSFTIQGIDPLVDGTNPNAFPFAVDFSTPTASFTVTPRDAAAVPEAPPTALMGLGLLPLCLVVRRRMTHRST